MGIFLVIHQLSLIFELVGTPNDEFVAKLPSEPQKYIRRQPHVERKDFKVYFKEASAAAVDLLEKLLEMDPDKR